MIYRQNSLCPISIYFKNTAMQKVVHINQKKVAGGACSSSWKRDMNEKFNTHSWWKYAKTKTRRWHLHCDKYYQYYSLIHFQWWDVKISPLVSTDEVYATMASSQHCAGIIPRLPETHLTSLIHHFLLVSS